MRIGEFSAKTKLSLDTVRFYEKVGFFTKRRQPNGYRSYSAEDLETAEVIACGKLMGFSLKEILRLSKDLRNPTNFTAEMRVGALEAKVREVETQILTLENTRLALQSKIESVRAEIS
ncbi:MAG: MerR family transcriptional regulator [Proteobacteria bacterium]|nr:MAG: MerR family transcriptional regulator [Pseudomonadota bacterium]